MTTRMSISVCPFVGGDFDVIIRDDDTGREVTLTGQHRLMDEEFEVVNKLAPSCVFTTYVSRGTRRHD